jgi:lipopolysaccharide assembly protein A
MYDYWQKLSFGKKIKLVLSLILGILLLLFIVQNWIVIPVEFVFLTIQIPVTLLILISLFIGFVFASFLDYKGIKTRDNKIQELEDKLEKLQNECNKNKSSTSGELEVKD